MKSLSAISLILLFVFAAFSQETKKSNQIVHPEMGDKVTLPEKQPQTAEEYYDYADRLWRKTFGREKDKVLEYLNKALELKPDHAEAFYFRGFVNNRAGKYQDSIKDLTRSLEISPDGIRAYELRAESKIKLKDFKGALIDYDNFINQYSAQGYSTLGSLQERGRLRYFLGDYDGAIRDFSQAISTNRSTAPYFFRAATYLKKGNKSAALEDFKVLATSIDEIFSDSIKKYPDMYAESAGYPWDENPLAALKKSESKSETVVGRVGVAVVAVDAKTGKPIKSEIEFPNLDEKLQLDNWFDFNSEKFYSLLMFSDESPVIFYHYGLLLAEQDKLKEAEESFTKSLTYVSYDSGNFSSWFQRGKIRLGNNQFELAVRDFSWAISQNKKLADAYLERGIAILMLGHDKIAQNDFNKYLALNPKGDNILQTRVKAAKKRRTELNKAK